MPRKVSIEEAVGSLRAGERIFLPGAAGEAVAFTDRLFADPAHTAGLNITTSFVPGINPLSFDHLAADVRVTGLFMQPAFGDAQRDGRFRHLPVSYAGFAAQAAGLQIDTLVVHVSPDKGGRCSLGCAVEFVPSLRKGARRILAVVNPAMPYIPGADAIALDDCEMICEGDAPLRTYDSGGADENATRIAKSIAAFVTDGATLQVGLGKVPKGLFEQLEDRRGLRIHSGMLPDSIIALDAAGALDHNMPYLACSAVGAPQLYDWLRDRKGVAIRGCEVTHDVGRMARTDKFIAINSALEVDLFGQCNLEHAGGRAVSGAGGAPDFARGAKLSPGGLSIVAMPASYDRGTKSRIVSRISAPGIASLSRTDIDIVVTEQGAADLRGRSVHERAERLIEIADPAFRAELQTQWAKTAAGL